MKSLLFLWQDTTIIKLKSLCVMEAIFCGESDAQTFINHDAFFIAGHDLCK